MTGLSELRKRYPWPDSKPDLQYDGHGWLLPETARMISLYAATTATVIIESGSWLGLSARHILTHSPNTTMICIDTWNGSPEHQVSSGVTKWSDHLPTLYPQFVSNMWKWRNRVIPVREDSFVGLKLIYDLGIVPEFVYLDSEHTEARVLGELVRCATYWPGAGIVLDDCNQRHIGNACRLFAAATGRVLDDSAGASYALLARTT